MHTFGVIAKYASPLTDNASLNAHEIPNLFGTSQCAGGRNAG